MNDYKMAADAYRAIKEKDPKIDIDSNIKTLDDDMKDRITSHVKYKFDTLTAEQAENYYRY